KRALRRPRPRCDRDIGDGRAVRLARIDRAERDHRPRLLRLRDPRVMPLASNRIRLYAIVAATLVVYAPALTGGFIWDDFQFIPRNANLATVAGLHRIWTDPRAGSFPWYPLTLSSFWLEYQMWGTWTLSYHVDNLLLHAVDAWLFGLLLQDLRAPGAWLAATIF